MKLNEECKYCHEKANTITKNKIYLCQAHFDEEWIFCDNETCTQKAHDQVYGKFYCHKHFKLPEYERIFGNGKFKIEKCPYDTHLWVVYELKNFGYGKIVKEWICMTSIKHKYLCDARKQKEKLQRKYNEKRF